MLDADVLRWLSVAPPDPAFFMDLLDVRMIIEPAAARLAASRATTEQILAMEAAYRGMVASTPHDMETCCVHDLTLHELIITATGNQMLIRFAAAIRTALLACVRIASERPREATRIRSPSTRRSPSPSGGAIPPRPRRPCATCWPAPLRDLAPAYDKYPRGFPPPPPAPRAARRAPRRT